MQSASSLQRASAPTCWQQQQQAAPPGGCPSRLLVTRIAARQQQQPATGRQQLSRRRRGTAAPPAAATVEAPSSSSSRGLPTDPNQRSREGSHEADLVAQQSGKQDPEQPTLASALSPPDAGAGPADVAVVGAGPAGLALAAELAGQGLSVTLVAPECNFVNNYGVWLDEFKELGLEATLDAGELRALL